MIESLKASRIADLVRVTVAVCFLGAVFAVAADAQPMTLMCDPAQTVIRMQLVKGKSILAQNLFYFRKPKDLRLGKTNINLTVKAVEDSRGSLELKSKNLAKNVFLDTTSHDADFSENYFDLLPGETRMIHFHSSLSEAELKKQLIIRTVSDTY